VVFGRKRNKVPDGPPEPSLGTGGKTPPVDTDSPEAGLTDPTFEAPKPEKRGWFGRRRKEGRQEPDVPTAAPTGPADPLRPGEPTFGDPAPEPTKPEKRGWFRRKPKEAEPASPSPESGSPPAGAVAADRPAPPPPPMAAMAQSQTTGTPLQATPAPSSPPAPTPSEPPASAVAGEDTAGGARPPGLLESPGGLFAFLLIAPAAAAAYAFPLPLGLPLPGWLQPHMATTIFALLFVLMLATVRLPASKWAERWASGIALVLLMATGALALGGLWAGGEGPRAVGGLLPFGAAHDVFINALTITEGGSVPFGSGWQASAAGPIATLLGATGQNLQASLAILVFVALLAAFLVALSVARSHGPGAGAMTLATLAAFYHGQILGTTAAANGSFILGCCAFALLWEAGRARRGRMFALGLFLLTLAFGLVGGAILVLPLLILWGARRFGRAGGGTTPGWAWTGGAVFAVLCGIVLHAGCEMVWGNPDSAPFGGLMTSLYGLAVGGQGPQALMTDHRTLFTPGMSEGETVALMAEVTLDALLANPAGLLTGIVVSLRDFLFGLGWLGYVDSVVVKLVLLVVSLCGLWQAFRPGRRPSEGLTALGIIGISASIPFIGTDTATALSATLPFMAALAGLGVALLFGQLLKVSARPAQALTPPAGGLIAPLVVGLVAAGSVLPGPLLVRGLLPTNAAADVRTCPDGLDRLRTRVSAGSSLSLFGTSPPAPPDHPIWGNLPPVWLGDSTERPLPLDSNGNGLTAPRLSTFVPIEWLERKAAAGDRAIIRYALDPAAGRETVLLAAEAVLPNPGPDAVTLCGRDLGFHFEVAGSADNSDN